LVALVVDRPVALIVDRPVALRVDWLVGGCWAGMVGASWLRITRVGRAVAIAVRVVAVLPGWTFRPEKPGKEPGLHGCVPGVSVVALVLVLQQGADQEGADHPDPNPHNSTVDSGVG